MNTISYSGIVLYSAKISRDNIFANLKILTQTVIFAFCELQVSHAPYAMAA